MAGRVRFLPRGELARNPFARPVGGKPRAAGGTGALLTRLPGEGHVATDEPLGSPACEMCICCAVWCHMYRSMFGRSRSEGLAPAGHRPASVTSENRSAEIGDLRYQVT